MKMLRSLDRMWPVAGAMVLGILSFCLTLEGAPRATAGKSSTSNISIRPDAVGVSAISAEQEEFTALLTKKKGSTFVGSSNARTTIRTRILDYGNLPVVKTIADWRDDEPTRMRAAGELIGPYRPRQIAGGIAGTGCSFDIDCDDCNPCTDDICDIAIGDLANSGTCLNPFTLEGEAGGCSDGLFCNGLETCRVLPSECIAGTPPDCAATGKVCDEFRNVCRAECDTDTFCSSTCVGGTVLPGTNCNSDGDCGTGGICRQDFCNPKTCNGSLVCEPQDNPCGPGGDCLSRFCHAGSGCTIGNGCANVECDTDNDCLDTNKDPVTGACQDDTLCYVGRCCTTSDSGITYDCNKTEKAACSGLWFSGETGNVLSSAFVCDPTSGGCPKYGAGISNQDTVNVLIGPIGTIACVGLSEIGDDYKTSNADEVDGGFFALERIEYIAAIGGNTSDFRISFEIYDKDGNFIEDEFHTNSAGLAVNVVEFQVPLIIPSEGYVVVRVADQFDPDTLLFIASTTGAADVGTNRLSSANSMWVNGGPVSDYLFKCEGGRDDGFSCNPNTIPSSEICPGGTCVPVDDILAISLVGENVSSPFGACCDPISGTCTEELPWTCRGIGGVFNQNVASCNICGGGSLKTGLFSCRRCSDDDTMACTSDDDCVAGTCDPNDDVCKTCDQFTTPVCDSNSSNPGADCDFEDDIFCDGGACIRPGDDCLVNSDCNDGSCVGICVPFVGCSVGACCNPGSGECFEDADETACLNEGFVFSGFGTTCFPDCCQQPSETGGDDCDLAFVHDIISPPAGSPLTITISGDNSNASGPDSCTQGDWGEDAILKNFEPGWWEAFHIDKCSNVIIDFCCSVPSHEPQWLFMWDGCPCQDAANKYFSTEVVINNLPANNHGLPICSGTNINRFGFPAQDNNQWYQFGPLPAGTYYVPVFSEAQGAIGPYQMHITVEGCPEAACCHNQCVGGGDAGMPCVSDDAECDGTCEPLCDVRNILECNDLLGTFLAPPLKTPAYVICIPSKEGAPGTCDTGSCCIGPGNCIDIFIGELADKEACDLEGYNYVGGIRCQGGECLFNPEGGALESCSEDSDCAGAGNECISWSGDILNLDQPLPCPVCEFEDEQHCHREGRHWVNSSDRAMGTRMADNFKPAGSPIETFCWFPAFLKFTDDKIFDGQCSDESELPPDNWHVTFYTDNGGVPGELVAPGTQVLRSADIMAKESLGAGSPVWKYSARLPVPVEVIPGDCYWIEITGKSSADGCRTHWLLTDVGDGWSMWDSDGIYEVTDAQSSLDPFEADLSFCLDVGMVDSAADCGPYLGSCCDCTDQTCTEVTKLECMAIEGKWTYGGTCDPFPCDTFVAGDDCAAPIVLVEDGIFEFDNRCANELPDGPAVITVIDHVNKVPFGSDLWIQYTATCTTDTNDSSDMLLISMCRGTDDNFDGILEVYADADNPKTCITCPTNDDFQFGPGADDTCVAWNAAPELAINVVEGQCIIIRAGGFDGSQGVANLSIECGIPISPPDSPLPDPFLKSRYVGFQPNPNWAGSEIAIRVTMADIDSSPGCNGNILWAGPPQEYDEWSDLTPSGIKFYASLLQSEPYFTDWTVFNEVQIYGQLIVPDSQYDVQAVDIENASNLEDEGAYSTPALNLITAKWGDVNVQTITSPPDPFDIIAMFNKLLGDLTFRKVAFQLQSLVPAPSEAINITDLAFTIRAWLGAVYPFSPCGNSTCGDGVIGGSEQCDDGNTLNNDGCDQNCQVEDSGQTVFSIIPIEPPASVAQSYPPGTIINNQFISLPAGGLRVWFDLFVEGWTFGQIGSWQFRINSDLFNSGIGDPLTLPVVGCGNDSDCETELGTGSRCAGFLGNNAPNFCGNGCCRPGFYNISSENVVDVAGDPVSWGVSGVSTAHSNFLYFATRLSEGFKADFGGSYYVGTLALDVPVGAAGTYDISLLFQPNNNFLVKNCTNCQIPVVSESAFVNVQFVEPVFDCCLSDGTCQLDVDTQLCADAGGTSIEECAGDIDGDGFDDNCVCPIANAPQLPGNPDGNAPKNRYISFVPDNTGLTTAIRVTLDSLHHPDPPNPDCCPAQDFSAFEGEVRWVGLPNNSFSENNNPETFFTAAVLQCEPFYMDWGPFDVIHVYGEDIVPSSNYRLQTIDQRCSISDESRYSSPLLIDTSRWGDITAGWDSSSSNWSVPGGSASFNDVVAVFDKWKGFSNALPKARAQLSGNSVNPADLVSMSDVLACVDAFLSKAYPFSGPISCP